jgi:Flp pilus assembly protein TadG
MKTLQRIVVDELRRRPRQAGAFAVMAIPLLLLICVFCAFAIDLGPVYNRKAELHGVAKAAALAAARELNGTEAGLASARQRAREAAERLFYDYGTPVAWSDEALRFGERPDRSGNWIPSTDAGNAAALFYARVDTARLDNAVGSVSTSFMSVFSTALRSVAVDDTAVAGRTKVNVAPIAVCAMAAEPAAQRTNPGLAAGELVEYGFRRGVSYDLMQLNPGGTSPVRYLVNPVVAPGTATSAALDPSIIGPFACTGSMWIPRVTGGAIFVSSLPSSSPLGSVQMHLNSRFDRYPSNGCSPNGAPPDYNIKEYAHDVANGTAWMSPALGQVAAASTQQRGKLETVADLPSPPTGTTAQAYGPLWAHTKAARYAATMPSGGYTTFATSDWTNLYMAGISAPSYPSSGVPPYGATSGYNYVAASSANRDMSLEERRTLNVPLLACPVGTGQNLQAQVLGIGKFFMMVPATNDTLVAEFGGATPSQSLTGQVELFP